MVKPRIFLLVLQWNGHPMNTASGSLVPHTKSKNSQGREFGVVCRKFSWWSPIVIYNSNLIYVMSDWSTFFIAQHSA